MIALLIVAVFTIIGGGLLFAEPNDDDDDDPADLVNIWDDLDEEVKADSIQECQSEHDQTAYDICIEGIVRERQPDLFENEPDLSEDAGSENP